MSSGAINSMLAPTNPSITYSGEELAVNEEGPRNCIVDPAVGSPPDLLTVRPATLPANNWSGELTTPLLNSSGVTLEMEPVTCSRRSVPYPMTTTSSNSSEADIKTISNLFAPETTLILVPDFS